MPSKTLQNSSPYSKIFHKDPNYRKLRIFGCLCYPWLRPYASHKLEPRSKPCVFVGYSNEHNAYLCLDSLTNKVYVSRHVVFIESVFPFAGRVGHIPPTIPDQVSRWLASKSPNVRSGPEIESHTPSHSSSHYDFPFPDIIQIPHSSAFNPTQATPHTQIQPQTLLPSHTWQSPQNSPTDQPTTTQSASSTTAAHHILESAPAPTSPPRIIQTRSKNNIFKPKTILDLHTTIHQSIPTEPTSLTQAHKSVEWRQAMSAEYDL